MGDLLGNILNSVISGGSASVDLTDILKKVAKSQSASKDKDTGNVATQGTKPVTKPKSNGGIDINEELDAITGKQTPASKGKSNDSGSVWASEGKGGIDLGSILGGATGKGGIDLGSILGAATGKGGIDLGSVLGAATGGEGGLDLGSILGAVLGGSQPSGGLTGSLSNANIGEIAQSVISVIGMASSAFGDSK